MLDREVAILIFAPATVGLVVMASRRMPWTLYLASLVGVIALTLVGLSEGTLGADSAEISQWVFGVVFIVVPTAAAFGVGRLTALNLGGAYVFAASCTAFVFGLGMASWIVGLSRFLAP